MGKNIKSNLNMNNYPTGQQLVLVHYHHDILRRPLKPVPNPLDPEIQAIIADMKYSIDLPQLKKPAAGMAANQWGIDWQIFLYCPAGSENPRNVEVILNPSYKPLTDEEEVAYEGCFSIPNAIQKVSRYKKIEVKYQDPKSNWITRILYGWEARVWQHENDHLMGILCDSKGERTLEKINFENDAAEDAFFEDVRAKRKQSKERE